jgi:hypothetical protein
MSSPTAADVCKLFELSDEAAALLSPDAKPRPFLETLIEKKHHADAALLMAHAMPKREAVWWACSCIRKIVAPLKPTDEGILKTAEDWVAKPSDELRRETFRLAEVDSFEPPSGFVGMAVFFSSGSLAPPGLPVVAPKEHLTATMVGNAVRVVAASQGGPKQAEIYPQLLALGLEVADGKNRWKE